MFSIVLKPGFGSRLAASLSALKLFAIGASWGGTRSLLAPMAVAADSTVTVWDDAKVLLRISVGLEDPDDLWGDLSALLSGLETG